MSKLSLDALKERAEETDSTELLATINGGTANSCHVNFRAAGQANAAANSAYAHGPIQNWFWGLFGL